MDFVEGVITDIENRTSYIGKLSFENGVITKIERYGLNEILMARSKDLPYIMPGFIDSHIHIELTKVSPAEYAALSLSQGVIGAIADCHDTAAVLGKKGVLSLIENSKKVPFYFGFAVPPVTYGQNYTFSDMEELLSMEEVTNLSECKDFPTVILHEHKIEKAFSLAKKYGKPVDGHAPGVFGQNLKEYCRSPVSTDHECETLRDFKEKLDAGLTVQVQTRGTVDLDEIKEIFFDYPEKTMLCSESIFCYNIKKGYLNKAVRKLTDVGADYFSVLKAACINPIKHYGLKTGFLKKGHSADFIIVNSPAEFDVLKTYIRGECVYEKNSGVKFSTDGLSMKPESNSNAKPVTADEIKVYAPQSCGEKEVSVNVIDAVDDETNTICSVFRMTLNGNEVKSDVQQDVLKVVLADRKGEKKPAVGFLHGFGIKKGALALSFTHDEHNFVCTGVSDEDIVLALNRIIEMKGGIAYAVEGKIMEEIPMEFGGVISCLGLDRVIARFENSHSVIRGKMNCSIKHPIYTLSYLCDTEVPNLKLSLDGLFNVAGQEHVPLITS